MKSIHTYFKLAIALALMVVITGCAATQNKENLLVAAGFKVITPKTAVQSKKLAALPAGKVTRIVKSGKTYYIFPDVANNAAYVGGPKQYQAYKQLRAQQNIANENLEAAEMNQDAAMNWGAWGGWYGMGPEWYGY
jgi:hypothetical protein